VRILVYSANFWPEQVGIGKYSGEMAHWLASQGHEVRVVAAPPYYPHWKVEESYRSPAYRRETLAGVTVWRAPLWVPKTPSGARRLLHLMSFALASLPVVLRQVIWQPDLVLTVAPALMCAPGGWLTARLAGAKAWLHVQDFEVDVAFNLGMLKSRALRGLALRLEQWMLRRFDMVSSISHRMVGRLVAKGVSEERTRYFPNWVDISKIGPQCSGAAYRRELGVSDDTTVVLYTGTLSAKQRLLIIPEVAALLAHRRDILFVVCGEGAVKAELAARTQSLPNVRLMPLQPIERLGELLSAADIHLLPQSSDAADLVLPSKLTGMMASGRPVVATCAPNTELASVVSQCGTIASPDDPDAVASAILHLAANRDLRLEFGQRARAWAEEHLHRDVVLGRVFAPLGAAGTPQATQAPATQAASTKEPLVTLSD
jgi:colanic acid biosynthesis glycosyl transferase WcaI